MTSVRTISSRAARLIVTTLVATIACAVVAPSATPVKASGAGDIDLYATLNGSSYFPVTNSKSNKEQDLNRRAEIYVIP